MALGPGSPSRHGYVHFGIADVGRDVEPRVRLTRMSGVDPLAGLCAYLLWIGRSHHVDWQVWARRALEFMVSLVESGPLPSVEVTPALTGPMHAAISHLQRQWAHLPLRRIGVDELAGHAHISRGYLNRPRRVQRQRVGSPGASPMLAGRGPAHPHRFDHRSLISAVMPTVGTSRTGSPASMACHQPPTAFRRTGHLRSWRTPASSRSAGCCGGDATAPACTDLAATWAAPSPWHLSPDRCSMQNRSNSEVAMDALLHDAAGRAIGYLSALHDRPVAPAPRRSPRSVRWTRHCRTRRPTRQRCFGSWTRRLPRPRRRWPGRGSSASSSAGRFPPHSRRTGWRGHGTRRRPSDPSRRRPRPWKRYPWVGWSTCSGCRRNRGRLYDRSDGRQPDRACLRAAPGAVAGGMGRRG